MVNAAGAPLLHDSADTRPGQLSCGDSRSRTVTVNVQALVLPATSVATQATVVMPFGNVDPLGGVQTTVTDEQLSLAVGVKVTLFFEHRPESVLVKRGAGQEIVGGVMSTTVMVWLHWD